MSSTTFAFNLNKLTTEYIKFICDDKEYQIPRRAIGYARVSTKNQGYGKSLAAQTEQITSFIYDNFLVFGKDKRVVTEIAHGQSNHQLQKLIKKLRNTTLIISDVSRFSRSEFKGKYYMTMARNNNISIIFIDDGKIWNSNNLFQQDTENYIYDKLRHAENELSQFSDRSTRMWNYRRVNMLACGRIPYGYVKYTDPNTNDKKIKEDRQKMEIITFIKNSYNGRIYTAKQWNDAIHSLQDIDEHRKEFYPYDMYDFIESNEKKQYIMTLKMSCNISDDELDNELGILGLGSDNESEMEINNESDSESDNESNSESDENESKYIDEEEYHTWSDNQKLLPISFLRIAKFLNECGIYYYNHKNIQKKWTSSLIKNLYKFIPYNERKATASYKYRMASQVELEDDSENNINNMLNDISNIRISMRECNDAPNDTTSQDRNILRVEPEQVESGNYNLRSKRKHNINRDQNTSSNEVRNVKRQRKL